MNVLKWCLVMFIMLATQLCSAQTAKALRIYMKGYKEYIILPGQDIFLEFEVRDRFYRKKGKKALFRSKLTSVTDTSITYHYKRDSTIADTLLFGEIDRAGVRSRSVLIPGYIGYVFSSLLTSPLIFLKPIYKDLTLKNRGWTAESIEFDLSELSKPDRKTSLMRWLY